MEHSLGVSRVFRLGEDQRPANRPVAIVNFQQLKYLRRRAAHRSVSLPPPPAPCPKLYAYRDGGARLARGSLKLKLPTDVSRVLARRRDGRNSFFKGRRMRIYADVKNSKTGSALRVSSPPSPSPRARSRRKHVCRARPALSHTWVLIATKKISPRDPLSSEWRVLINASTCL